MTTSSAVKCYSGDSYAQRPCSFYWQGNEYAVSAVIKEGYTPQGKVFLVQTTQGLWFNLAYIIEVDQWQINESCQPETPMSSW
ncbi:MAG: hypothetical protein ABFS17_07420 [Chloroflexota bacterium]